MFLLASSEVQPHAEIHTAARERGDVLQEGSANAGVAVGEVGAVGEDLVFDPADGEAVGSIGA